LYVEERELKAALYVVPTPIGNFEDMTLRAISVLQGVDLIAAEDTRHSRMLLSHYDPGYVLVRSLQDRGLSIIPLPGACAAVTALSAAGLPTHSFRFEGFLSAKRGPRRSRLDALKSIDSTLIFYEAPHRILDLLGDMLEVLEPDREMCIAREITKTFETIRRGSIAEIYAWVGSDSNQQRGELVVMVASRQEHASPVSDEALKLLYRLSDELPPRKAAQLVADHYKLKSRALYQLLLNRE
jgi:16S rRNA (cytidine1402-2'-O)-methyltransferase